MNKAAVWKDDNFVHHWKYYVGPARASPSDLEFIKKKILEKGSKCKVLILGATPEYRDLCGQLGLGITLIDFSRYNYEYLADEVRNRPKERFIRGNWLKTALDKKFDIILGDNVINMLHKGDVRTFLSNLSKMLKEDGFFMPRTYIREKGERMGPEEAINEYNSRHKGESVIVWTIRDLYLASYDLKSDSMTIRDVYKTVLGLHKKGILDDTQLEQYKKLSLERDSHFFFPLREWLEKVLSEFFRTKEIFYGKEGYLKGKLPLHVLAKR